MFFKYKAGGEIFGLSAWQSYVSIFINTECNRVFIAHPDGFIHESFTRFVWCHGFKEAETVAQ
ncbi:Uncharacterised protein [Vibrio cholerae]|nr:Uncharacterised protein [Vibrio cholerae]